MAASVESTSPSLKGESGDSRSARALMPERALELAWTIWFILLAVPFIVLPFLLHMTPGADGRAPNPRLARDGFAAIVSAIAIAVPVSLMLRVILLGRLWHSHDAHPRRYFVAMLIGWLVLTLGGIAAEVVCVFTGTLLPNVVIAVAALLVYLNVWPRGTPMVKGAIVSEVTGPARECEVNHANPRD